VGTPHYMAPEQAFQDGALDARADLWSVGVILYECLSGCRPVEGDSIGQVLKQLARLDIRPLAELAPGLPSALTQLVDRLLAEHDARPSSAGLIRKALEDVLARGIDDTVMVRLVPVKAVSDSADGMVMDRGSWLHDVRSRHAVHAGIGALVLVVFVSAFASTPPGPPLTGGVAQPRYAVGVKTKTHHRSPQPAVAEPKKTQTPASPQVSRPSPKRMVTTPDHPPRQGGEGGGRNLGKLLTEPPF